MTDTAPTTGAPVSDITVFVWHPEFAGRTPAQVQESLRETIASDQRAYALAMEAADGREAEVLATIVPLERRWGGLSMDWATVSPDDLARVALEAEVIRERTQQMTPYSALRSDLAKPDDGAATADYPERSIRLTDSTARMIVLLLVLGLAAIFILRVLV